MQFRDRGTKVEGGHESRSGAVAFGFHWQCRRGIKGNPGRKGVFLGQVSGCQDCCGFINVLFETNELRDQRLSPDLVLVKVYDRPEYNNADREAEKNSRKNFYFQFTALHLLIINSQAANIGNKIFVIFTKLNIYKQSGKKAGARSMEFDYWAIWIIPVNFGNNLN
jgi:hypothetical protein